MNKIYSILLFILGTSIPLCGAQKRVSRIPIFNAIRNGDLKTFRQELKKEGIDLRSPLRGTEGLTLTSFAVRHMIKLATMLQELIDVDATLLTPAEQDNLKKVIQKISNSRSRWSSSRPEGEFATWEEINAARKLK